MDFYKHRFHWYSIAKIVTLTILLVFYSIAISGCAVQNKHKKIKSVPCPCETQNRKMGN